MYEKLSKAKQRLSKVLEELSFPEVYNDNKRLKDLNKERSDLEPIVNEFENWSQIKADIAEYQEALNSDDKELADLAEMEIPELETKLEESQENLKVLLLPQDPNDGKDVLVEIRAGTGGDEAALFVADLLRMYSRFAEGNNWKIQTLSSSSTGIGGYKEVIIQISGNMVYSNLKYESGIHRVQRVPATESQGRIHTSAVTVAVLPEAEEVDINVEEKDLRIDVYRSSGPGGQSVNTTDSAVRITHVPTGLVVTCQDEKSQHKNKAQALKVLRARLYEQEQRKLDEARSQERKSQVGSGDRSGRIRTYNFPQGRVSDHRINLTLYQLTNFMEGDLNEMITSLRTHFQSLAIKAQQEINEEGTG